MTSETNGLFLDVKRPINVFSCPGISPVSPMLIGNLSLFAIYSAALAVSEASDIAEEQQHLPKMWARRDHRMRAG